MLAEISGWNDYCAFFTKMGHFEQEMRDNSPLIFLIIQYIHIYVVEYVCLLLPCDIPSLLILSSASAPR